MKIFLIGGFGYIGKRLIHALSVEHTLIIFSKNTKNYSEFLNNSSLIIDEGSIEDETIFNSIKRHKPDIVIHLAALGGLKKCQQDPSQAFSTNVYGTFNVVNACCETRSKLIFCSSREVYGQTQNDESKEDDPLSPQNVYGLTKYLGEKIIETNFLKNKLDYTILRISNVYGPDNTISGVNKMIKDAVDKNKISIQGGKQTMNFVYIDDVVKFIKIILGNKKTYQQVFNVGSFDNVSVQFFAEQIKSLITKTSFEYSEKPKIEINNFKLSLKKAISVLNYEPQTKLIDGIKNTIDYYSMIKQK